MATHHLTITSNIMLLRSHMVNTKDWHPSNTTMSTPLKTCESSHWCFVIIIKTLWQSPHSIIISHSPSSHKITIFSSPDSLKSCAMAQIWMLYDNSSASATSSSSQTTLSSWSIYHHAKPTSGITISDSTWSNQGNDGKNRQWYCSVLKWTRVVKSYNGPNGRCHVRLKIGRSSSPQNQGMDMDMVLLWSKGEMGHSLELLRSVS